MFYLKSVLRAVIRKINTMYGSLAKTPSKPPLNAEFYDFESGFCMNCGSTLGLDDQEVEEFCYVGCVKFMFSELNKKVLILSTQLKYQKKLYKELWKLKYIRPDYSSFSEN